MLEQADVLDYDSDGNTTEVTRSFYHRNALGSVMEITDANEANVASYRYDPYGNMTITRGGVTQTTDPLGQHWGFTGRFQDEDSGLWYYRARYYDSERGRFMQRDPLGYSEGPSLFEYTSSRPTQLIDPSGLNPTRPPGVPENAEPMYGADGEVIGYSTDGIMMDWDADGNSAHTATPYPEQPPPTPPTKRRKFWGPDGDSNPTGPSPLEESDRLARELKYLQRRLSDVKRLALSAAVSAVNAMRQGGIEGRQKGLLKHNEAEMYLDEAKEIEEKMDELMEKKEEIDEHIEALNNIEVCDCTAALSGGDDDD